MVLIAFWLVCGMGAFLIADHRGANGCLGGILGLLLGPLGVVFALFMGGEYAREQRAIASGQRKKCPMCAELVQREARVCRHCGHRFDSAPDADDPDEADSEVARAD